MNKNVRVKEVFDVVVGMLRFRREMVGEPIEQCLNLKKLLESVTLNNEPDRLIWKLTNIGEFLVKSMYLAMQCNDVVPYTFLWKIKIPHRVKTFLWLVLKGSILTRDILLQREGANVKRNVTFVDAMKLSVIFFSNVPWLDTFGMWLVALLV
jgi:hypothetical protein